MSQSQNARILVVEDELSVSNFLEQALRESGLQALVAHTVKAAAALWEAEKPDLVLLDLMLPDGDGLELLRERREAGSHTPVIVLSARSGLADRVTGLDLGADDYLPKPFSLEELLARVRAQLRRVQEAPTTSLRCGDLEIDLLSRRAMLNGRLLFLSTTEFRLLELLATNMGQPVSKSQMLEHVWDDPDRDPNVVEVYVNYLRNKLERGGAPRLIHTVRGRGYVLQAETPAS
ncbi:MAG TPA: response regulator transcription factor [Fimbriimonas sp.]|nr:response regulator transcription factor [Fimbriimonas sp.]